MNIHSIHFEEGIKPRLRSARETRLEQEPGLPRESYLPSESSQESAVKAEQERWRQVQGLTCRH